MQICLFHSGYIQTLLWVDVPDIFDNFHTDAAQKQAAHISYTPSGFATPNVLIKCEFVFATLVAF